MNADVFFAFTVAVWILDGIEVVVARTRPTSEIVVLRRFGHLGRGDVWRWWWRQRQHVISSTRCDRRRLRLAVPTSRRRRQHIAVRRRANTAAAAVFVVGLVVG